MRELTAAWFEPGHQPDEANKVAFELRPLDMPTFWTLQANTRADGAIEWPGAHQALEYSIVNWKGLPQPYSAQAKREFLKGLSVASFIWLNQVLKQIVAVSLIDEDQRKNS